MKALKKDALAKLNRDKLKLMGLRMSIYIFVLVVIIMAIVLFIGKEPISLGLALAVIIGACILLPILLVGIAKLALHQKMSVKRKAFSQSPFDQLEKIGFHTAYKNVDKKWHFTEEIKQLELNNYVIRCDISAEDKNYLEFEIETEWQRIGKERYDSLSQKFREQDIEFRIGSLVKRYNLKNSTVSIVESIRNDMREFTILLKQENFISKYGDNS